MNWLDLVLLAILAVAAVKGFMRGFIIEVCSLLGFVLGIWAGVHLNGRVALWLGLDGDQEVLTFIVVFIVVLLLAHLIGKGLTRVIDIAQLALPNKLAGIAFGVLRSAFVLSVLLNILLAKEASSWPPDRKARESSVVYGPLRAFAPMVVPALADTKWVKKAMEELKIGTWKKRIAEPAA